MRIGSAARRRGVRAQGPTLLLACVSAAACAPAAETAPAVLAADTLAPRVDSIPSHAVRPPEVEQPVGARDSPPAGALLPARRVVAFYGNPRSRQMGILGELEPEEMLQRLEEQAGAWALADPSRPVIPALHLVTVVAHPEPGPDSMYRAGLPDSVIARVSSWAERRGWLLILDIQPGRSAVRDEVERLLPWLRSPHVHLALDPEFAMYAGGVPGERIGTMDADDINAAIELLAGTAEAGAPKLLIVHRFTKKMVTGIDRIHDDPRVQVVIDMDGFGTPQQKRETYRAFMPDTGPTYAGFKLFYKQDEPLMTVEDVLALTPVPLFVVYQ